MTRLKLNCCGEFINGAMPSMSTFKILCALTAVFLVFTWITNAVIEANDEDGDEYSTTGDEDKSIVIVSAVQDVVSIIFGIFLLVITIRTRVFIRQKYQIPTKCCGGCEGEKQGKLVCLCFDGSCHDDQVNITDTCVFVFATQQIAASVFGVILAQFAR